MKNVNRDFYYVIRKNRESSYGFMKNASLCDVRYYNEVIKRNWEITEQLRHRNGIYWEINQIIKNEANILANNR